MRILIARLSHIGDCVLTLPLASALRRAMPTAYIGWIAESAAHPLLELSPDIDYLHVAPKGFLTRPDLAYQIRDQLRPFGYDIAIDPQGLTKSAAAAWLSGAPRRIGPAGQHGREFSRVLNNRLVRTRSSHLVDRTLELLQEIGIDDRRVVWNLDRDERAERWASGQLARLGIGPAAALINVGAAWPSKLWEMDRFAAVSRHLRDARGIVSLVVWGGPLENRLARDVARMSGGAAILAPPTDLRQLAALARRARLMIASDTGPLHIASAMGTPCVGLHGATWPSHSGAYGPQHRAVQRAYQGGTSRQRRRADNSAMRQITVADVCRACEEILDTQATVRAVAS